MLKLEKKCLFTTIGTFKAEKCVKYHFPEGIFGLSEHKYWYLLRVKKFIPFMNLISDMEEDLIFYLINKKLCCPNYTHDFYNTNLNAIQLEIGETINDCEMYFITNSSNKNNITVNLKGPVLFNTSKRLGVQLITRNDKFHTKHKLLPLIKSTSNKNKK